MEIKGFKQSWQPVARKTNILRMSKCTYTALMRSLSNLFPSPIEMNIIHNGPRKMDILEYAIYDSWFSKCVVELK